MGRHKGNTIDDYIRAAAYGMTKAEAAVHLGVKVQTVCVIAAKHGITFVKGKRGRKPSDEKTGRDRAADAA